MVVNNCKPSFAFQVLYNVPIRGPKRLDHGMLSTAEAMAIKLLSPILCAQKSHVKALLFVWPKRNSRKEFGDFAQVYAFAFYDYIIQSNLVALLSNIIMVHG